jgi:hypothetical protein
MKSNWQTLSGLGRLPMADSARTNIKARRKWAITFEWNNSVWVAMITLGKRVRGTATADDLETAMDMATELIHGAIEWPNDLSEFEKIDAAQIKFKKSEATDGR